MKNQTQTAGWYTTPFIVTHLKKYFFKKGFRLIKEDYTFDNGLIIFSRLLVKEKIELRGTFPTIDIAQLMQVDHEQPSGIVENMKHALEITLSPISYFSSEERKSICLPGLAEYEEVLEKLRDYFISNNLELKVYFVNQDGSVKFVHLKQKRDTIIHALDQDIEFLP